MVPALSVTGLRKCYGDVVALEGLDLLIEPGEVCGLLGPNGAGKTTLVSIVAGLRQPDAGTVSVAGVDAIAEPFRSRALLGYAPQDLAIYPTVRVRDNLAFFGALADLRGAELDRRIDEVAEVLDLGSFIDRSAHALSGGEKRRVHTAMALLHRPPLLLLDEPTTGVDVQTRTQLLEAVRRLAKEDGAAVCYSTHYLPEVEALGASVAIIDRGSMIARGDVSDLVRRHGAASVEVTFDGEPPAIDLEWTVEIVDSTLRLHSDNPAVDAAALLTRLGAHSARIRKLEFVTPSLETVFLALTGRRFDTNGRETSDADVTAPL